MYVHFPDDNVEISCCAFDVAPAGTPEVILRDIQKDLDMRTECMPITVPSSDGTYPHRGCMNFVRSAIVPQDNCGLSKRTFTDVPTCHTLKYSSKSHTVVVNVHLTGHWMQKQTLYFLMELGHKIIYAIT